MISGLFLESDEAAFPVQANAPVPHIPQSTVDAVCLQAVRSYQILPVNLYQTTKSAPCYSPFPSILCFGENINLICKKFSHHILHLANICLYYITYRKEREPILALSFSIFSFIIHKSNSPHTLQFCNVWGLILNNYLSAFNFCLANTLSKHSLNNFFKTCDICTSNIVCLTANCCIVSLSSI